MPHVVIRVARHAGLVALFVVAASFGILTGVFFAYAGDLPQIAALDDYTPSTITRVYAAGGEVIGEFATERRVMITFGDIAPRLREAIVSAEDADFNRHAGVSITRIMMTAIKDIVERPKSPAGASTLTQQLARKLFLTPEKSLERKIKEAILAIQIEKRYTKQEIFTLYCNKMYFGQGAYGVEAAARLYFNKSAREVNLDEAALLAGILQLPNRQNPVANMRWARQRRNYVLQRMADEKYITQAAADEAKQRPIVVRTHLSEQPSVAPYFVEEIRKYLEDKYGAKQLYEQGLSVQTSLDYELQLAANRALDEGLRRLDKRRGWRRAKRNVLAEGRTLDTFTVDRWARPIAVGDIVPALVVAVAAAPRGVDGAGRGTPLRPGSARLRVGTYHGELLKENFGWTRRASAADLVKPGDVIDVRITKVDEAAATVACTLEQEPIVEGAFLALDNRSGQIKAMVGGFSFARSKFNRAVQAYRQMGSGFKPIVYTAAIDRGFTPATILLDTPASFPGGAGQPPYTPHDYDGKYEGAITLRRAIEQSRNVPAVRTTEQIGPPLVIEYARRFGFQGQMDPYLSLALGASDATLVETASAFSAFPNQGVRMRPYTITKISDRDGNLLEENRPEPHEAVRADTAFIMTNLLRGVVQRGTGAAASALNWPLAGKTGTTNDYGDAWFTGFDPNLTAAVWIGFDDKKPLGAAETGAVAALPVWMNFMKTYIEKRCDRQNPPTFQPPPNIVFLPVDRATGTVTVADGPNALLEAFIAGTQPGGGLGPDR